MSQWIAGFYTEDGERYFGYAPNLVTDRIDEAVRYGSERSARESANGYASGVVASDGTVLYLPPERITGTFAREVQ